MKKNIRTNYLLKVKKVLDEVDKAGDTANHFRGIAFIGDAQKKEAYSWVHAPVADMERLMLDAFRHSSTFMLATARALETYCKELNEKDKK